MVERQLVESADENNLGKDTSGALSKLQHNSGTLHEQYNVDWTIAII